MIQALRKLFRPQPTPADAAVPPGERVYAIGDIHGRHDLLVAMIAGIEADDAARGNACTTVILLGDLVDRGPDSARVIAAARAWQRQRRVRILAGNHEEMFLLAFNRAGAMRSFLRYGGRETILSYPVDPVAFNLAGFDAAQAMMAEAVPAGDRTFIEGFEDSIRIGDYLFVHAGIEPGVAIDEQRPADLRWIREPFLSHGGDHGCVVIHGHTITDEPEFRHNRIGLDTGAYLSGRLTAIGLEGNRRWLIATEQADGKIATSTTTP
jgi:serine/threonine protein phosphatase 1